ncbi:MAG: FeoB-associated Cys-rich membrane protein [Clostridia bacterium]|nr:FeoB-associated Cys-rich membrane protein [Clostridia bacterium]
MLADIIVGLIVAALVVLGAYRFFKSAKNNTCAGCSGGCSLEERSRCKH